MEESMELTIRVNPGTVTQNFAEFKALLKEKLDNEYKNIVVTDEGLREAKAARARLNKAKESLRENMRSAQRQNDEPLQIPKAQAKELEALLDEAILTLDEQIKAIETKRFDDKYREGLRVFEEVFDKESENVSSFAKKCKWICKPEWGNATYSMKRVREDCERAAFEVKSALALLTGEFAPQMLDDFRNHGSISKAQLEGKKLEKAREEYRNYLASQAPMPDQSSQAMNTIKVDSEPYTVNPPTFFRKTEEDDRIGSVDMRFRGKLYQIKWLRSICKAEGIELEFIKEK